MRNHNPTLIDNCGRLRNISIVEKLIDMLKPHVNPFQQRAKLGLHCCDLPGGHREKFHICSCGFVYKFKIERIKDSPVREYMMNGGR